MATATESPQGSRIKDSIYLGYFDDDRSEPMGYRGPKHLMCFGPPDSGKSTSIVVPVLGERRGSCIVIDPKGQIAAITARHRAKIGRVIVLNPFNLHLDEYPHLESARWNPLLQIIPELDDAPSVATKLAEATINREGSEGNSRFFDDSSENAWAALSIWERMEKGKNASLREVRARFASADFLLTLKEMKACNIYAVSVFAERLYNRLTNKNAHSNSVEDVVETIMANTKFLNDNRIADDMFDAPAIDFAAMHREVTTVYLILPPGYLREQSRWLRMFVNLSLAELMHTAPPTPTLPRVLYLLDEFANLGRLPEVVGAINVSRDYRVQLFMFMQSVGQLKKRVYAKEWDEFMAGSGAKIFFTPDDWETAQEVSTLCGEREYEVESDTSGSNGGGGKIWNLGGINSSRTIARQVAPLIAPENVMRIPRSATINFIRPATLPVRGYAPGYWQLPNPERYDRNPYYHS